ncbi:MAG: DNA gyrase subunit A [Gammaproteobacteria bacterium]|nr:DNA gyrase subunit A [Gammaproteobacteria bacterium]
MAEIAKEIFPVNLEDEMRQSYLEYAMSVIVGRALPDVRDGLKPVHRRVLFAMNEMGNDWNKSYRKSARIVGDVIGKYHPHGDTAVYDTIVRMAQPFSLRYMLVDGQGNFGSVDGDSPAAMRYTEIRMAKIAHHLMADLEKETVDFTPNYDESEYEPSVLPSRVPNLLVNGSSGIAVGMATNIPPHNLGEIIDACVLLVDNPLAEIEQLMECVPGPDFPTAAFINGSRGIHEAYRTGKGKIYLRARTEVEEDARGKQSIIVNELPYQVNKARLLEKIAELVKDKKIEGITALRDESDKDGMRMVIELRRGEVADVVINNLYKQTQMQNVFGINMVALLNGQPKLLTLKDILQAFILHRREVITRRTVYDLRKARERAHILEGLAVALSNIDEIIALIKQSANPAAAKVALLSKAWEPGVVMEMVERSGADASRPDSLEEGLGYNDGKYFLSEVQAQSILDMRLNKLTGLEQDKIIKEYREILENIEFLLNILRNESRLMEVVRDELVEIKTLFNDERRTEILINQLDMTVEDLITEEDVVVTLSHLGYAKAQPVESYSAQRRGGRGKAATKVKDEDFVEKMFVASTHDTLLCFSTTGKMYWQKVFQLPIGSRIARGQPLVNLLPLEEGERITAILPVRDYPEDQYIFFATANGTVKRTALADYSRPRANGIRAIDLRGDDSLVGVQITDNTKDLMLFSASGKGIRFDEKDIRIMGRTAGGVRGIRLKENDKVISLLVTDSSDDTILFATENGYGKRTKVSDFSKQGRGGQGVISIQTSDRNGSVIGAVKVDENNEIMLITNAGTLVRTSVDDISIVSRNTQGVTLIRLTKDELLVQLVAVVKEEVEEIGEESEEGVEDNEASADSAQSGEDSTDTVESEE